MNEDMAHEDDMTPRSVGTRLREAREAAGKSLADIAEQTRVPVRLLSALERDAVEELPAGPYAIGFTRSFAQAVGLNPDEVVAQTRILQQERSTRSSFSADPYEPADDSRVPPRGLALIAGIIFLALLGGYFVLRNYTTAPLPTATATPAAAPAVAAPAAGVPAAAPVAAAPTVALPADARLIIKAYRRVLFSLDDASGRGQFDLTLDGGEFYTIRPNQRTLRLRTGHPEALRIVVGDRELPQLGPDGTIVSGIALDNATLSRIAAGEPPTVPAPGALPGAGLPAGAPAPR